MQDHKDNEDTEKKDNTDDQGRSYQTEQRPVSGGERRADDVRRQDENPFEGDDRRNDPDRRTLDDRRGMLFDVVCKTSGSLTTIEDWLDDHCQGTWTLVILDVAVGDDLTEKNVKVMFELATDKHKFVEQYGKDHE